MSTTTTTNANEGWTFADNDHPEFPTMTELENDWSIAGTTTNGWEAPPTALSPPLSTVGQPCTDDHAFLHWTAYYDDYYGVHRQMKDNSYYPRRSHHRRHQMQTCDCPMLHPDQLLEVTRDRHLDPVKACADWHQGKRVCPECRFLVNKENHHLRYSTAAPCEPLADITPPQKDQKATGPTEKPTSDPVAAAAVAATLQDEQITLLGEIVTMIHETTTQNARRNHVVHCTLAQRMNEFHDTDQQQLQRMANTLEIIIAEQQ